ncbi:sulfatase family protein [Lutibacter citreus]|uniref:sulfatase family protein n=1 Tax=Lutibacter citreus TaxID=2138210 RepID=UPI000DBE6098|nr:sulfatase-like hydrolase/transferase [Lutibacter citreus]
MKLKLLYTLLLLTILQFSFAQEKPNIVIIMTDQQFADAMSCVMGNQYINTPNIDNLAKKGVMFTRAYSPNPLCQPMRTSMVTGSYPHQTGIQGNWPNVMKSEDHTYMGKVFKDAGYETGYFGKWHVALDIKKKELHGFDICFPKSATNAKPAVNFIKQKHEKPYIAVASFLSPHEICEWSRWQELPIDSIGPLPPLEELPPLKANFSPPQNETDVMTFMRKSYQAFKYNGFNLFPTEGYTDSDWRRLRWGYYRLIERADAFVGEVLDAVKESGQEENTLIVFLSDHGDCAGSHKWNQKTVFYDESVRVPLIMKWDGKTTVGRTEALVNTGIDLIPTLCDFAGIETPKNSPGKSLMGPATGNTKTWKREFVISENHMTQCEPVNGISMKPHGRMVRSKRYKYCVYSEGVKRESLIDMQFDPGETVNQASNPLYKKVLEQHREYLKDEAKRTDDKKALEILSAL